MLGVGGASLVSYSFCCSSSAESVSLDGLFSTTGRKRPFEAVWVHLTGTAFVVFIDKGTGFVGLASLLSVPKGGSGCLGCLPSVRDLKAVVSQLSDGSQAIHLELYNVG